MFHGHLLAIFVADWKGAEPQPVEEVRAVSGQGLEGDRYAHGAATGKPDREVTLIELEALEALKRDYKIELRPSQTRRNLLTHGVPLNHLVGKEFTVGAVVLRGIRLCDPCTYLEKKTENGVLRGLTNRGGLRAQIVQGGVLKRGDVIAGMDKG